MSFLPITVIDSNHTNMHLEYCIFLKFKYCTPNISGVIKF